MSVCIKIKYSPFPTALSYSKVTYSDCNNYRKTQTNVWIRLENFRVYLSQHDHINRSSWNWLELFSLHATTIWMSNIPYMEYSLYQLIDFLTIHYHNVTHGTVREFQYACSHCRVKRWHCLLTRQRAQDCSSLQLSIWKIYTTS